MPAAVFILERDGLVLMERRGDGGRWPNAWLFPGGKCDPGESPEAALLRECREELGITPIVYRLLAQGERIYFRDIALDAYRLHPFLVTGWMGDPPAAVLDSGAELPWRSLADAVLSPVPWTRRMAEVATRAVAEYRAAAGLAPLTDAAAVTP